MNRGKVLVVDDEYKIVSLVKMYLEKNDYEVMSADTGKKALRIVGEQVPDLIVLDILLPDVNGLDLCNKIRLNNEIPIIYLSCLHESETIIKGLDNGGDDYLTKPFDPFPAMLYVAAGVIFLLGIFTPIHFLPTTIIAGALFLLGFTLKRAEEKLSEETEEEVAAEEEEPDMTTPENVVNLLTVDPIEFEFGYGLIPLADANQGGDLLDRVVMIRRQLALEMGMVVPVIRIRDNIQLQPNEYVIKIRGNEVARGELLLDHYMAMSPGVEDESITGIETTEPAFGLPALWIGEDMKDQAELSGYTVVDPPSVVSTHLTEVIKAHAHELLGREETKQLVDHLKESYPTLVEDVTPNPLSLGDIQKVLSNLLKENVSIRNLPVIFETLAEYGHLTKDMTLITEYVRQSLSRQITKQ